VIFDINLSKNSWVVESKLKTDMFAQTPCATSLGQHVQGSPVAFSQIDLTWADVFALSKDLLH
jgi:hypothetical protein